MNQFSNHYKSLHTDVLLDIAKGDLTDEAKEALQSELNSRGISPHQFAELGKAGEAERAGEIEAQELLGSRFRRFFAFAIDTWVLIMVLALVLFPVGLISKELYSNAITLTWLAYFFLRDAIPGQGIGKRLLRIRVVTEEEKKPCSIGKSIARNLTHLFFLIDALFVLGRQRKRLGDILAHTIVIRRVASNA